MSCVCMCEAGLYLSDFSDCVHVDEKWFYVSKLNSVYYLSTDKEDPHNTISNKQHMTKVMSLVAVARPKYDSRDNLIFDGKIGLWPVIEMRNAIRSLRNRAAGSDVIVPVEMSAERYKEMLIEKVLSAIKAKWIGKSVF